VRGERAACAQGAAGAGVRPTPPSGRVRRGPLASTDDDGNNGAFLIHGPLGLLTVIASDGSDWSESGLTGLPWEHVSVSTPHRTPTWKEMHYVKALFWADDEIVMQLHPAQSDWVNNHAHCLHLWRPLGREIPTPPAITVGSVELGTIHR